MLAFTGSHLLPLALAGLGLVGIGSVLHRYARRLHEHAPPVG
ncbi:MAG TPA: hypothetical protein VKR22_11775 [Acidimicrobiales bacterium]|nr:hypothetical protein [Acidimicrobiales bacterium]